MKKQGTLAQKVLKGQSNVVTSPGGKLKNRGGKGKINSYKEDDWEEGRRKQEREAKLFRERRGLVPFYQNA